MKPSFLSIPFSHPETRPGTPWTTLALGTLLSLGLLGLGGCAKGGNDGQPDERILKLRRAVAEGKYESGLDMAREISSKVPLSASAEEAFFLQGYILAYGKTDFQGARLPLKHLLDSFPKGPHSQESQRLLADCHYWQGHYETAGAEYAKLLSASSREVAAYALFQTANCLLLDDKVGEAQETYRSVVEKHPADPLADSAQLMLANSYVKLQNFKTAKAELKKLVSFTRNKEIQRSAQRALRQIEEESSQGRVDAE